MKPDLLPQMNAIRVHDALDGCVHPHDPRLIPSLASLASSRFKIVFPSPSGKFSGNGVEKFPFCEATNRRKSWRVLTSAIEAVEAFFHSEKFAVENLEKQKVRNEPPGRQENKE